MTSETSDTMVSPNPSMLKQQPITAKCDRNKQDTSDIQNLLSLVLQIDLNVSLKPMNSMNLMESTECMNWDQIEDPPNCVFPISKLVCLIK